MSGPLVEVRVTAMGEVRNAAGELISREPIEATFYVTEDEARALGYTTTPTTQGEPS